MEFVSVGLNVAKLRARGGWFSSGRQLDLFQLVCVLQGEGARDGGDSRSSERPRPPGLRRPAIPEHRAQAAYSPDHDPAR